jgi:chromosome segregation ATPase
VCYLTTLDLFVGKQLSDNQIFVNILCAIMDKSCTNDYFNRTCEELARACEKHKNAALAVKDIAEGLKKKLRDYREMNSKLYGDVEDLESDIIEKDKFANKLAKQRNELEMEVRHLREKVEVKNSDLLRIDSSLNNQNEILKTIKAVQNENDDLKDQLKAAKIQEELDNKPNYEKEIRGLKEEINAISISNRTKDIEIEDLKEKVSSGKENELSLEGKIGTKD